MSGIDPLGWVGHVVDDRVAVEAVVGEGGFGIVYRGTHLGFREPVALKCLKIPAQLDGNEREQLLDRFRTEARMLHRLSRKTAGIVQALDVGAAQSPRGIWSPYIVMEWLDGVTLEEQLLERERLGVRGRPLREVVGLLTPAARALAVAHQGAIAHLDVKPANLFLTRQDDQPTVKVLDFGIARVIQTSKAVTRALTQAGGVVAAFTPNYAAPEQFDLRHGSPGAQTDVFALALIVIELATGRQALTGANPIQLYLASANEARRPSLADFGAQATDQVETVLRKALAVDPSARHADAGELWDDLSRALMASGTMPTSVATPPRVSVIPVALHTGTGQADLGAGHTVMARSVTTGRHRVCTVLSLELVGGTTLTRRFGPEVHGVLAGRAFEVVRQVIEAAGGSLLEQMGERALGAFGLRTEATEAAARAVHAALRLPLALADPTLGQGVPRGARLQVRVGVATGKVYARLDPRFPTAGSALSGEPVGLACRLAQSVAADAVAVDRDTHRQVAGLFEVEPLALPTIEPDAAPIAAFRVAAVAMHGAEHGIVAEAEFHGRPTALVGRAAEMDLLTSAAEQSARESQARLVTVVGPSGVGLSRLLFELARTLREQGHFMLTAHASTLESRTSYALAAALLRGRFHIHEDDPRDLVETKLVRGVRELRAAGAGAGASRSLAGSRLRLAVLDPEEIAATLLRVLGHDVTHPSGGVSVSDQETSSIKHRVAGAFAALLAAAQRPVAVLCDNVHMADTASLELLDDLLERAGDQPLFVACAGRAMLVERRPRWGQRDGRREVCEVRPLPRAKLEEIVRDRLAPVDHLPAELTAELAERADGCPLALTETLHLLIDRGAIDTASPERWQLRQERLAELPAVPTTVQGIVQARIDRLDDWTEALLLAAAVVGPTFWVGALTVSTGRDRSMVTSGLADLCSRGLVRRRPVSSFPDEHEYGFAENAVQLVAYEMLGQAARSEIHRHVAEWLEARTPTDGGAALVARHYERAAALDLALGAYQRAGRYAAALGQNAEARACYSRACRLDAWIAGETEPDGTTQEVYLGWEAPEEQRLRKWPDRVRLRYEFGLVERRMGELEPAFESFAAARGCIVRRERRVDETIDPREVGRWDARIDFALSLIKDVQGQLDEARQLVERALDAAEPAGLVEERAEMLAHLAALHLRLRDIAVSRQRSLEGLRLCRTASGRGERRREAVAWLLRTLGGACYHRGKMASAERCYLQAASMLDEARSPTAIARVLNNVAAARFFQGRIEAARDAFRRALELSDRGGDLWMTMTALGNLGEVEHRLGRSELARDYLEQSVLLGERIGARADLAECYRNLAIVRAALGERAAALTAASHALALAVPAGGEVYLAATATTVAELCADATGEEERRDAVELARALDRVIDCTHGEATAFARCRELIAPLLEEGRG